MIKILQFGEGNFLRAFTDVYFNTLNEEGFDYRITVVKPRPGGSLEKFKKQNNVYHTVLRGSENGETVERVYRITSLENVICPFHDPNSYYALAYEPDLKLILSNTTEAGICFDAGDAFDGFAEITFPAKLTKFLFERFKRGLDGVYILPVELIDRNADTLKDCIDRYISLWQLPEEFRLWNNEKNYYCNTLVDRIVSGYPRDIQTINHLQEIIGQDDLLMTVGEPFGLWVVEKKGEIEAYIKEGKHNIDVVLTEDISDYKKRKVRILNGSHTNLVSAAICEGATTVYDCMKDIKLKNFLCRTLDNEIVPFVSQDITQSKTYADNVLDRFVNPYLNHQLTSIALNSISKWRARILPSFKDYYATYRMIAPCLTIGFSYLIYVYSIVENIDNKYIVNLKGRTIELSDDKKYLTYFTDGGTVTDLLADDGIWGEDLTAYPGFEEAVRKHIEILKKGGSLI